MEFINFLEKGIGFWILLTIMVVILIGIAFLVNKSSKKKYTGRIVIPVFFIELAVVFGILLLSFPDKGDEVGPGVVPGLWIIGILGLSIFLLIRGLLEHEEEDPPWGNVGNVAVFIAMTILYLIFMQLIGYMISTFIYLITGMFYLKYRNWKVMIAMAAGWITFSYFAFYRLLYVPLPKGKLIEWIFG